MNNNLEIEEIISSYNEYISRIPNGIEHVFTLLRNKDIAEALNEIKNFSEGLVWLESATGFLTTQGFEMNFSVEKIKEFLSEINEGLLQEDWFLVADIFEHELLHYFKEFQMITLPQQ